jgi:F-type H+-transporting ATPase subunit c
MAKKLFSKICIFFYSNKLYILYICMEQVILLAAKSVGAGLATIALAGVGAGIGVLFAGYCVGFSRNPNVKADLFGIVILGFALTEAIGLFALMMAFLLLFT